MLKLTMCWEWPKSRHIILYAQWPWLTPTNCQPQAPVHSHNLITKCDPCIAVCVCGGGGGGSLYSAQWDDGMERWNGMEWNGHTHKMGVFDKLIRIYTQQAFTLNFFLGWGHSACLVSFPDPPLMGARAPIRGGSENETTTCSDRLTS